jgi:KDO2-lipid IV(A) lauroyltransferase
MARNQPAWLNWSQYLAARTAGSVVGIVDPPTVLRSAASVADRWHRLDKRHRDRAEAHLRSCFPDWPQQRIQQTAAASSRFVAQLAVEILLAPRLISADNWQQRVRLTGIEPAVRRVFERRPMILLTGHCGNWEIWGWVLSTLGVPLHALARPLDNPIIWRWFAGIRERRGLRLVTKWGAADDMIRILQGGGMLGVIADQNAGDQGLFVPFFNRLASTYKSIGLLALRYDVPIACGHAVRLGDDLRYELRVEDYIEPSDWQGQPDPLFYIAARYNKAIEDMIRRHPENYLWMHRRWKSRPRFERQGKPMPASLKEKLANLPWMDERTLARLVADSEAATAAADDPVRPGAAAAVS